jgi:predicted glutamine amidotransferase
VCRLFGFRSSVPSRPHRSLMDAENALAAQSLRHPDGWGIGWFAGLDAYVVKSATPAHSCARFKQVSERLLSHTFLVHVRRATVGAVDTANAHPFRYGRWLFAHNGTVFGFPELGPWMEERTLPELRNQIVGDTDSERLFLFLLSMMARVGVDPSGHSPPDARAAAGALRQSLVPLDAEARRRGLPRPICNVILTDGRSFLAHRAGMPLHLSTQKKSCADRFVCPVEPKVCLQRERPGDQVNHLLVASEPIGDENLWEDVPDGATVVLTDDFHLAVLPPPQGWIAPIVPNQAKMVEAQAPVTTPS